MVRQEVHVAPISQEVDRIVLPFLPERGAPPQVHAHRLILVVPPGPEERATVEKVRERLGRLMVLEEVPLEIGADRAADFRIVLQTISRILLQEQAAGNRTHLNLSSGAKMVCVAAGMAGMAHIRPGQGTVYHVRHAGHSVTELDFELHGRTKGIMEVEEVELVPILLPEPLQLRILGFLSNQPKLSAEYRDMIKFLNQIPGSGYNEAVRAGAKRFVTWNNAVTTRMVRKILTPLEDEGLVEIKVLGRQRGAQLTSRGLMYAALAAPDQSTLFKPLPH